MSASKEFFKGFYNENPVFRLALGLCPTLAVTISLEGGFGMGVAFSFVLILSNIFISLLRNVIPKQVRLSCYIIVIATFVSVAQFLLQAYAYPIYDKLGIFIPLIVVNCIVLGRAEAFAAKNGVVASIADALGMGIGYTLSLSVLGALREILGAGTLTFPFINYSINNILGPSFKPFAFFVAPPGAFVCLGLMLCVMNMLGKK